MGVQLKPEAATFQHTKTHLHTPIWLNFCCSLVHCSCPCSRCHVLFACCTNECGTDAKHRNGRMEKNQITDLQLSIRGMCVCGSWRYIFHRVSIFFSLFSSTCHAHLQSIGLQFTQNAHTGSKFNLPSAMCCMQTRIQSEQQQKVCWQ